jgi:hypothetical protein
VALILDLAVIAIAAVVVGSLALLTWTFAVSSVLAVRRGRQQVAAARAEVAVAERRIMAASRRARTSSGEGPAADADGGHTDA